MNHYEDIINLPHHVSKSRPHMSLHDRAAQFSPFAALTGHEAAIEETARLTEQKIELNEEIKEKLDRTLTELQHFKDSCPMVCITFFQQDERKSGGRYLSIEGYIRKLKRSERLIIMENGIEIAFDDVLDIQLL